MANKLELFSGTNGFWVVTTGSSLREICEPHI